MREAADRQSLRSQTAARHRVLPRFGGLAPLASARSLCRMFTRVGLGSVSRVYVVARRLDAGTPRALACSQPARGYVTE